MEENNERCIPDRHHHDHNTIAAIAALGVVAYLGQSQCLGDLGVLLSAFSLTDDTWLTNAGIIKWYVKSRGAR